jgi:Icc-related predicted phosphoesterase
LKKFCCISDTHSSHNLVNVEPCDFVVHAGDAFRNSDIDKAAEFINWFAGLPAKYKILVGGNHDRFISKKPDEFRELIANKIIYLENSGIGIEGIRFWGSPSVKWCGPYRHFTFKNVSEEQTIFEKIPTNIDVLVTHSPPYGILDFVPDNNDVDNCLGSKVLLEKIHEIKPKYHIFGHIHQSYGTFRNNHTFFVNACLVNDGEEPVNMPVYFDYM